MLFLALGAALTATIAGLNGLAGVPILDLGVLFAGLHSDPHAYWWLYAMVFSTIVPTAVHGGLSLLGAQALAPLWARRPAARLLTDGDRAWKAVAAPLAVGAMWAGPFLSAALILWGLWTIGADALAAAGGFYLQTLTDLAVWIGAF
ncbi:MAG: hypothetical protein RIB45_03100 [Marivibrio sp.]|uniref:hypothetical protein n=1 Tax=Marivibrio sp. TaxID=2039719 RepID=UPI0032ECBD0F